MGPYLQYIGNMCSKLYAFCLEFIMVADYQEDSQKKTLFSTIEKNKPQYPFHTTSTSDLTPILPPRFGFKCFGKICHTPLLIDSVK